MLVRTGEIVAVDGTVQDHEAVVDESAMTGESLPVTIAAGANIRSGITNAGEPFEVLATRRADESSYAALVRLVEAAESDRAPFVRLADRYAVWFLGITVVLALVAWAASGDPVRAVAVLVIATPCPLILAAPIALVAGLSRAARAGVIIKGGAAIEGLGAARSVLLDKTGTLTVGHPSVHEIVALGDVAERRGPAARASLDQLSPHVLAAALVRDATARGLHLEPPDHVSEEPGGGSRDASPDARCASAAPRSSKPAATTRRAPRPRRRHGRHRRPCARHGRRGRADARRDRDGRPRARRRRRDGRRAPPRGRHPCRDGDRRPRVRRPRIAERVGVDRVYADCTPEQKLEVVRTISGTPGHGARS